MLVWHVKYQHIDQSMMEQDIINNSKNLTKNSRLRHRLDIKKDDVQIVLPISKVSSRAILLSSVTMCNRQPLWDIIIS